MEKIYRVQMNSKGMPNFSTAVEIADRSEGEAPLEHGYMWTCPKCGLDVHSDFESCPRCGYMREDRPQGEWIRKDYWSEGIGMGESYGFYYECSNCGKQQRGGYYECGMNYCPNCRARLKGAADE